MNSIFEAETVAALSARINRLTPTTEHLWGSMTVDQMLAHVNVAYEMVYDGIHKKPSGLMRWVLKKFVKEKVVGPAPYARNTPTAPVFKMKGPKDFTRERERLLAYMLRVYRDGAEVFEGKESHSFGPLTVSEWNVLFYKHLDHHLTQFGV